ncbi:hypothetical protein D9619_002211 [Psilocybe cf. subviscida]|uniref:Hydantoinase n=1 Tax=Psilocybe cf. subviscida TaxID=2480587 RepID=A0A8H5BG49_9AGAR|nr:hypothetical protein D9619_002211 [Psilocybe cf. subviscida]
MRRYRIGVDVGGTNTDAVLIDTTRSHDAATRGVLASFKIVTTPDITSGIERAVRAVLDKSGVDPSSDEIRSLTIGTTHFINAVVQLDAARLAKVAVVRLAYPYTTECPPFIDFPEALKALLNGHTAIIHGGLQIDGRTINDLREDEVVEQARIIKEKGLRNVVLVGVYSPLDVEGRQEYKARDIMRRELGDDVNIICSCDVGHVGFIERENASILNASIMSFAQRTVRGYKRALRALGLQCPLYLTQNDGTLTSAATAARLPIKTFSSGATNSMRGASYLAGMELNRNPQDDPATAKTKGNNVIVVDIGGTTTDVGVLLPSGFPRQAAAFIEVAGVRTNFTMPDVHSIGLGGGSRVRALRDGRVTVGPDSVGHHSSLPVNFQLTQDSLLFGGTQLTATDIISISGDSRIGDASLTIHVSKEVEEKARTAIKRLLEIVVDKMKTSPEDSDLLLVGGGSIIAPQSLKGVRNIILPKYHEVANAVGAAIANVSGEVDTVEILEGKSLSETLERIKKQAVDQVVNAGGDPNTSRIVDVNVLPVQYVTNQATRIIVRAVGELDAEDSSTMEASLSADDDFDIGGSLLQDEAIDSIISVSQGPSTFNEAIDYTNYKPKIDGDKWVLSETDLFFIMEGCGILGTGGGGSPYPTYLACRQILRDGGTISVVDPASLNDNDLVVRGCFMGSPSVSSERIHSGRDLQLAALELAKYCGVVQFAATLRYHGIPALDGDLMGRAVYNRSNALVPCALNDGSGNTVLLTTVKNDRAVEGIMRVVSTEFGSCAALCTPPLSLSDARDFGVTHTQSQAWRMGRAVAICRQTNNMSGISDEILKLQTGVCLFVGKIIDVTREVRAGFTWGEVRIARLRADEMEDIQSEAPNSSLHASQTSQSASGANDTMLIPFQNENLCAYLETEDGSRKVAAIVPDLITILDSQSGSHLGTPEYTYGLRVTVIALASHPLWRTTEGLKIGGPLAFGLEHEYVPLGEYLEPKSVIAEYGT